MSKGIVLGLLILCGSLLVACSGRGEAVVPKAEMIRCTAAYRASVAQSIEREESVTFTNSNAEKAVVFADMVFHAVYSDGEADNERALRLWVTDGTDTAVYHTTLYQLPFDSGPQNQFVGGHGFTGLHYSYAPDSSAELQFWCEAIASSRN
ncbi:hypothetical protein [Candidatus Leptofilum sp.]|uniref:hypothetical protein n=1 Tax=Candidatus Leptofilum sp. TaxID=3241576 RepID=UPI003B5C67E2